MSVDILSWLDQEEPVKPMPEVRIKSTDTLVSEEVSGTCFEIQREVLLSLMEKAVSVVPTRDIIPVLTNFQFQVTDDELKIVASSGKLSIVVNTTQIETKVAGVEIFPARTLLALIKEANVGTTIYIEVTSLGIVITAGNFSAEIAMPYGKGFPAMDLLDGVDMHEVDRLAFINAISTAKYALPTRDHSGQAALKMINIKGGKFTACDGSRFQQTRIEGFKLNMKLPSDNISLLLKIFNTSDLELLEIGELPGKLVFRLGNTVCYMNKVDDAYPNVEQLWLRPALSNDQELIVNRQELTTAVKQVKLAAESNAIGLILKPDHIEVRAKSINSYVAANVACKWLGKERSVVVNYLHLAEMLKAFPLDECNFYLGEDTKGRKTPILLKNPDTLAIATISQLVSYRAGLTD